LRGKTFFDLHNKKNKIVSWQ